MASRRREKSKQKLKRARRASAERGGMDPRLTLDTVREVHDGEGNIVPGDCCPSRPVFPSGA
jgi:hypothetical protein